MYSKALIQLLLIILAAQTHTQRNGPKVVFIEASSSEGKGELKTSFCLGPVHLV